MEKIELQENDYFTDELARKKLYDWNGLEIKLDPLTRLALDVEE